MALYKKSRQFLRSKIWEKLENKLAGKKYRLYGKINCHGKKHPKEFDNGHKRPLDFSRGIMTDSISGQKKRQI